MVCFIVNALLYLVAFVYLYRKYGMNLYTVLYLEYAILAIVGIYIIEVGIYEGMFGAKNWNTVSVIPFILSFLTFVILFHPLKRTTFENIYIPETRLLTHCLYLWLFIMVAFILVKVSEAVITLNMGLGEAYDLRHSENESLFDYTDNLLIRRLNYIGNVFLGSTSPFVVLYAVQRIRLHKTNLFVILLLVSSFIPNLIYGIAIGSRGMMFAGMIRMLFYYFLLKKFIPLKFKKKLIVMFLGFLSVAAFYSMIITEERLAGRFDEVNDIFRYFGECFPNLQFSFWEHVKYHPMGDRLFPDFTATNQALQNYTAVEWSDYWVNKTGVPIFNFKTMFGDLYIEFGVVGSFIFILLFSGLFRIVTRKGIRFYNINYYAIYFQVCAMGFAGLTQIGGFNNTIIIFMILFNIFLKWYYDKYSSTIRQKSSNAINHQ